MTDPNTADRIIGGEDEGAAQPHIGRGRGEGPLNIAHLLLVAAVLGLVAAFAAIVFTIMLHDVEHLLWSDLPDAAGWSAAALRAPFFGVLFAASPGGSAAAETISLAILGAVTGWLIASAINPAEASVTNGEGS